MAKRQINQIEELRTRFRNNPRMRLEYIADLSKLLREHNIDVHNELLGRIVPATMFISGTDKVLAR